MKNSKKWTIAVLVSSLVIVIVFGAFTYYADPLLQYRKEQAPFTYHFYNELYVNPGIAKNYDYDAVLVGSSMVENTDVYECNKLWNCTLAKLPYSGASSYNHKKILDICFDSHNSIKTVYWNLDVYALAVDADTPRFPLPEYLYNYDVGDDLSYLLNLDIFANYTRPLVVNSLRKITTPAMSYGNMWAQDQSIFSREKMLASYDRMDEKLPAKSEKYFEELFSLNMDKNIRPLIENHRDTQFVFFAVPYSILYWDEKNNNGEIDADRYMMNTVVGELLKYDNVRVFYFQDKTDIICDLDNYKDYTHYKPQINSLMTKSIANGEDELTLDNYQQRINGFFAYLKSYDFDSLF